MSDQILQVVAKNDPEPSHSNAIAKAIGLRNKKQINPTLFDMQRKGMLQKVRCLEGNAVEGMTHASVSRPPGSEMITSPSVGERPALVFVRSTPYKIQFLSVLGKYYLRSLCHY